MVGISCRPFRGQKSYTSITPLIGTSMLFDTITDTVTNIVNLMVEHQNKNFTFESLLLGLLKFVLI